MHANNSLNALKITKMYTRIRSEDYYGDLDLKAIRKSELLAGLSASDSGRNKPGSQQQPRLKPRPTPAQRNAPEPAN